MKATMSHWSRVLRRLHKRRKTEHSDDEYCLPPAIANPGPITRDITVLRVHQRRMDDRHFHKSHYTSSSTDSSQRWTTADEGPMHSDPTAWGSNFWVTIIDPQTQNHFYACPATGECSWDPPAGNFVLPPSNEGEWWELNDESRSPPVPYYHHTRTGETSWTRPKGAFVIPLGIVQTTTLGRRLSRTHPSRLPDEPKSRTRSSSSAMRRTTSDHLRPHVSSLPPIPSSPHASVSAIDQLDPGRPTRTRTVSTGARSIGRSAGSAYLQGQSETSLDAAAAGIISPDSKRVPESTGDNGKSPSPRAKGKWIPPRDKPNRRDKDTESDASDVDLRVVSGTSKASSDGTNGVTRPMSEQLVRPQVDDVAPSRVTFDAGPRPTTDSSVDARQTMEYAVHSLSGDIKLPRMSARDLKIGQPIPDPEAAAAMSPINRERTRPIPVQGMSTKRLSTGDHRMLPRQLAEDIQQFQVSDFARRYFSTHKTGLIFRRRVPVEQLMVWQKPPLTSPLLILNRSLHKNAVLVFKVIQRIMGDRERDRPVGVRMPTSESLLSSTANESGNSPGRRSKSSTKAPTGSKSGGLATGDVLEEERWLLAEGIEHGELRDEIYCQVVKQLTDNPSPESAFRGWQLLCVLLVTFPPSKNFEGYLRSFMLTKIKQTEGRIDVMAKYCLHRLPVIAKKGPRGKPPTATEITNAADSAFNPSTFGESLSAIMRLQERTYANSKVPIILPFLADGILALGGTKSEGIFRIPGDADEVSDLRVRIDKGFYNLEGIDDCNVPASLFKLWLRELQEPLIPSDMYNACIQASEDPERVVALVKELPTNNRRVLLFVISFLQLFLSESVQTVTKMTSANMALVMAPNLLRCDSESMAIVFTNARFEHMFVHHLLLHLKCSKVDPEYVPIHGLGASSSGALGRGSQSRPRTKSAHRESAA
ncbi:Rho GTPase-activating-like protein [Rhizoctonia solani 123E]|uniref:Rho GTPase-activating-like protein n=1 Tax=Rhizoctonia solani 123E TaxID=1423351 RepID=A0A074S1L6_9AGAM|nr:Rho GTPase-activating-like protein [Rhizoctonia solani 123E]